MTSQFFMVDRSGPPEAMHCPMFLCAVCSEPVYAVPTPEHDLPSYVLWWCKRDWDSPDEGYEQLGPFVVHEPFCDRELERQVDALGGWGPSYSSSFEEVVEQLVYNAAHPIGLPGREDDEDPSQYLYRGPAPVSWVKGTWRSKARRLSTAGRAP